MNNHRRIGLAITTYEGENPTLTYTFWSNTIQGAVNVAKSHLITDEFFSGSYKGGIPFGEQISPISPFLQDQEINKKGGYGGNLFPHPEPDLI